MLIAVADIFRRFHRIPPDPDLAAGIHITVILNILGIVPGYTGPPGLHGAVAVHIIPEAAYILPAPGHIPCFVKIMPLVGNLLPHIIGFAPVGHNVIVPFHRTAVPGPRPFAAAAGCCPGTRFLPVAGVKLLLCGSDKFPLLQILLFAGSNRYRLYFIIESVNLIVFHKLRQVDCVAMYRQALHHFVVPV